MADCFFLASILGGRLHPNGIPEWGPGERWSRESEEVMGVSSDLNEDSKMTEYRKEDWTNAKVEIRASTIHGKGMFAVAPIEQSEVVAVWGGRFVNRAEADTARLSGKAIQQIEEDVFEVFDYDKRGEDPTYYQNHSCDPNTWMSDEVTIIARRDIQGGEELTIDYALFEANEDYIMPWECRCGAPGCRKQITGKDWRLSEIQERYRSHFSPLIIRRIALKRIVSSE